MLPAILRLAIRAFPDGSRHPPRDARLGSEGGDDSCLPRR
jgi:hypothetical protein